MASYPLIDPQTLKKLGALGPSPLAGTPAMPNLSAQVPSLSPETLAKLNLFSNPSSSPSGQSSQQIRTNPSSLSPSGNTSGPQLLPTPLTTPAVQNTGIRLLGDQNELQRLKTTGSGVSQIQNPVLRTLGRIGDVAESILLPGAAAMTPGTTLHNQYLQKLQTGRINNDIADQQQQAQTTGLNLANAAEPQRIAGEEAQTQAQTGLLNAQAIRARIPPVPTVKYSVGGLPESADDGHGRQYLPNDPNLPPNIRALFDQANQNFKTNQDKTLKPLTQQDADSRNAVWNPIATKHHLPLNQFMPGMSSNDAAQLASSYNNVVSRGQGDAHVSISLNGLDLNRQKFNAGNTLDTSDPATAASVASVARGDTKLTDVFGRGATMAQKSQFVAAVKQVNPNFNSGDHDIENASRKYFISGQGGSTLNAGQTLTHHLGLYDQAVDAVHNGDTQILNKIGNEFGIQMGSDAQTNLALIRQGVAMEAARFYTGGVPGEAEINQFNKSLSGDGSPAQMHGGASTVRAMAAGKMQSLQGQAQAGSQGQANFGGDPSNGQSTGPAKVQYAINPKNNHKIMSHDGGNTWMDAQSGTVVH